MSKPVWSYEYGALRVRFGAIVVICPDIDLSLTKMVELTIQYCKDEGHL